MRGDEAPALELEVVERAHYVVDAELARGGMGRILKARDLRHGRPVAIKELLADTPALRLRFRREALITARLQHPAIVPVYEAGRWPSGEPFYAMKMVEGRSLDLVITERKTLEARLSLLPNVIAVTEAIAYAHQRQIIHRDLKPANILVGGFGETVVIDWGLAKDLNEQDTAPPAGAAAGPASEQPASSSATIEVALSEVPSGVPAALDGLTLAGRAMGTPAYMAPEQARGEGQDPRVDVYALGALLYHLLAGRMPYADSAASTGGELLRHVVSEAPTPLGELEPRAPRDLVAIVDRAMAREPGQRYASAKELAADLRRFETGQLVSVRAYSPAELFRRWLRRNRVVVGFAAVVVVLLAVGGAFSVTRIVDERDRAEQARADAVQAEELAVEQKQIAETRAAEARAATLEAERQGQIALAEQAKALAAQQQEGVASSLAAAASSSLVGMWIEAREATDLEACFLRRKGPLRWDETLQLTVDAERRAQVAVFTTASAAANACIKTKSRYWKFPRGTQATTYTLWMAVDPQTGEARINPQLGNPLIVRKALVRRHHAAMSRCHHKLRPAEPVEVKATYAVAGDGSLSASIAGGALDKCIEDEVVTWRLPSPRDDAGAPFPVHLSYSSSIGPLPAPPPEVDVSDAASPSAVAWTQCPHAHLAFDDSGVLAAERVRHRCRAWGDYLDRKNTPQYGWHSHDPVHGNAQ